ncbi:MAG: FAD-dependent oxidoreductase, partial [Armatimonadota bacterium]
MVIEEKSRAIPVWAQADVLVAGGGTAGVAAAVASARLGAKTLLVESTGQLGGSQTGALVTPMMPNHINNIPLNKGLNEELQNRYAQFEFASAAEPLGKLWHNPTNLAFVLEDVVLEAGADILYNTLCVDVLKEGSTVVGTVMENKSGRGAVLSKVVIDCTGDADLAFKV